MKTASQRFSNVVKEAITPILKECGFKKKGQNYFKSYGDIGHALDLQKDKWNSKDEIRFTINIGIFSSKFWLSEFDFEEIGEIPEFPKESESIIRERIGDLKYGKDFWYSIESQSIERKLIKEVENDIKNYVLPYFKQLDSTEKVINHLRLNENIYGNDFKLFVLVAEEGLKEEAQRMFDRLLENVSERRMNQLKEKGRKYKLEIKSNL